LSATSRDKKKKEEERKNAWVFHRRRVGGISRNQFSEEPRQKKGKGVGVSQKKFEQFEKVGETKNASPDLMAVRWRETFRLKREIKRGQNESEGHRTHSFIATTDLPSPRLQERGKAAQDER